MGLQIRLSLTDLHRLYSSKLSSKKNATDFYHSFFPSKFKKNLRTNYSGILLTQEVLKKILSKNFS